MPCTVCNKTDKRLEDLESSGEWECSHVDCPKRRRAWSERPRTVDGEQAPARPNPVADLLDNQGV